MTPEEIEQAEKLCAEQDSLKTWGGAAQALLLLPKALAEIKRLQQRPDVERYGRLLVELEQASAEVKHAKTALAAARKKIRQQSVLLELQTGALEQACDAWPNAIDRDTARLRAEVEELTKERDAAHAAHRDTMRHLEDVAKDRNEAQAELAEAKAALGILKHDLRDIWCIEKERYGGGDRAKYLMDVAATALAKLNNEVTR